MAMIASEGLQLWIGDGAGVELFNPLKGTQVKTLEIIQRMHDSQALSADGWQATVGSSQRRVLLECEALATDDPAPLRLRAQAMLGAPVNVRLAVQGSEMVRARVHVTRYVENLVAGEPKRLSVRLESDGTALLF
jgi:hypothetical protein